jgi:hypothetical protein
MLRGKMDLRSIVAYLLMKDLNAREVYTGMNGTLGADCIGDSTIMKYLRAKSFSESTPDMDFELKIEEENFIDTTILGVLRNTPFPHSARLRKQYSFQ